MGEGKKFGCREGDSFSERIFPACAKARTVKAQLCRALPQQPLELTRPEAPIVAELALRAGSARTTSRETRARAYFLSCNSDLNGSQSLAVENIVTISRHVS